MNKKVSKINQNIVFDKESYDPLISYSYFFQIRKIGKNKKLDSASILIEGRVTRSIMRSHNSFAFCIVC
jgi:hypothetical protein